MGEVKTISQIIEEISPYYKEKKGPEATNALVYDSSSETLEPLYFFIVDLMNDLGLKPEKLVDNFSSTPGSGHFAELGQRATIMQQQAGKILGDVNTVLRSVLNIVYDLKDFRIRIQQYDSLKSKSKEEQDAAILALKQIWMDKVDIQKGNSSLKAMALGQAGFQTLLDAFLIAKDEKEVDKIDLNDRVKRVLKPRIFEFNNWLKESEKELKKRYELEKTYLKSQVNSLKLYSRWVRPYLKAASDLEQKEGGRNPALVKTFNTIILELTLLGKTKLEVRDEALQGNLPKEFSDSRLTKGKREYYSCVLVDFTFRGIPQKISQQSHFAFGGRAEVTFKAYALNNDELKKLDEELGKSDVGDVLNLIQGASTESLNELQEEIDFFLEDKETEKKEKKSSDESNPFLAMIGFYDKPESKPKETEKKKPVVVRPEDWIEKNHLRRVAAENAATKSFDLFDIYKKAHGMASFT